MGTTPAAESGLVSTPPNVPAGRVCKKGDILMYASVKSAGVRGLSAELVTVEVDLSSGLPRFDLVGLPNSAVSESKERVRSAVRNCGFQFPISRITVNLAPADFRKEGPIYDLPIFTAMMLADHQIISGQKTLERKLEELSSAVFLGELSLRGDVRRVRGVLPMLICAREQGMKQAFIPAGNAQEATAVCDAMDVYPVRTVKELLAHLRGERLIEPVAPVPFETLVEQNARADAPDFSEVIGQHEARRALEIAAAGGHNVLLVGPPGAGKSMLAKRLPGILPAMTYDEALETTNIYSVGGLLPEDLPLMVERPFRAPHHTATLPAMAGGGAQASPGEVTLAHNGVLFLDETPHFARPVLEALRQPLEDRCITIARNRATVTYPGNIQLIGAMTPCPCGWYGVPYRENGRVCSCSLQDIRRYADKLSGPFLDRIDLHVRVRPVPERLLLAGGASECSADIRARVVAARAVQKARFEGTGTTCNAGMNRTQLLECCALDDACRDALLAAHEKHQFSARSNDKILKVARTIADLAGSETIELPHLLEAVQLHAMDLYLDP